MWNVVGHTAVVEACARSIREGTPAHAYLLTGPAGVGKRALATDLAMALNCEGDASSDGGPCGDCRSCRRIFAGKHSDVLVVGVDGEAGAETSRKNISIEQIREVGRFVSLEPFEGRRRVVIIDGAEAMSLAAANAFLKTLEEPPAAVTLMLLADHEESLLDTIRSRCHRLSLPPVPRRVIADALAARWGATPEQAELLSRLARGRIGWAVQALNDATVLEQRSDTMDAIHRLVSATRNDRFAYAAELATKFGRDRQSVLGVLDLWREWWRDVLHLSIGAGAELSNNDDGETLEEVAGEYAVAGVVRFLDALERTATYLQQNVNPRLALESLFLQWPGPALRAPSDSRSRSSVALGA